jgi:hypothetical protein
MSSPAVRRSPVALALLAAITLLLSLLSTVPAAHADVDYFDTAASASYSDFSSPTGAVVTVSSATHVWVEMSITPAQWASWDAQDPNGEASLVLINDTTGQLETVFVGGCGQGGGGGLKFGIRSPLDTTDTQCVFGFRPGAFTGTTHFVLSVVTGTPTAGYNHIPANRVAGGSPVNTNWPAPVVNVGQEYLPDQGLTAIATSSVPAPNADGRNDSFAAASQTIGLFDADPGHEYDKPFASCAADPGRTVARCSAVNPAGITDVGAGVFPTSILGDITWSSISAHPELSTPATVSSCSTRRWTPRAGSRFPVAAAARVASSRVTSTHRA